MLVPAKDGFLSWTPKYSTEHRLKSANEMTLPVTSRGSALDKHAKQPEDYSKNIHFVSK